MKPKHRHIINEYNLLDVVNAGTYIQLSKQTYLDALSLVHLCPDIVVPYAGNNKFEFVR